MGNFCKEEQECIKKNRDYEVSLMNECIEDALKVLKYSEDIEDALKVMKCAKVKENRRILVGLAIAFFNKRR